MSECILYANNQISPNNYDWDAAFNDQEFIDYIKLGKIVDPYYDDTYDEISSYMYCSNSKFIDIVHSATFYACYKNIGSHAFESCHNLKYISFPASTYDSSDYKSIIYKIDDYAFANCSSLYQFECSTVKKIGRGAFLNCFSLYHMLFKSVSFPDHRSAIMFDIDDEAFKNCYKLHNGLSWISFVNRIGKHAFANCSSLFGAYSNFPGSRCCYYIDDYAFENCINLNDIILNSAVNFDTAYYSYGMMQLGKSIFNNCSNIFNLSLHGVKSIMSDTLGDGVSYNLNSIVNGIDSYCPNLIYYGSTEIGSHAFESYSKLNDVRIAAINVIGERAFGDCSNFLNINGSLGTLMCLRVKERAFENCIRLPSIYFNTGASFGSYTSSYIDLTLILDGSHIFDGCSKLSIFKVAKCHSIPAQLFYNKNVPLKIVSFGMLNYGGEASIIGYHHLGNIGELAFANCSELSEVTNTLINRIGSSAFLNCISLKYIPGSSVCREIGDYAYSNCVDISGTIYLNMANANTVSGAGYDSITIGSHAFDGCYKISSIYLRNVTNIGEYAFKNCSALVSFVETAPMTNTGCIFGAHAFENLSNLSSYINSPYSNYIGDYAFANCINLRQFPGNRYIGAHAFENCYNLNDMNGMPYASYIGEYAFYNCSNIPYYYFTTGSTKYIGDYAFANCVLISSATLLNTEYIGSHAFENCFGLSSVIIFNSASYIGEYAFAGCSNLSIIAVVDNGSIPGNSIAHIASINVFESIASDFTIRAHIELKSLFMNDSVWVLLSEHFSYFSS